MAANGPFGACGRQRSISPADVNSHQGVSKARGAVNISWVSAWASGISGYMPQAMTFMLAVHQDRYSKRQ